MTAVSMEPNAERWDGEATQAPPARFAAMRGFVIALLVMVVVAGSALALQRLPYERWLPLRSVVFEGNLTHISEARLRSAIGPLLHGGLLGVNVTAIRLAIEALPWVDHVTVHRVWPDSLRITLTEQVAAARWGETALLNGRGEIFRPSSLPPGLPHLAGPAGSERLVLQQFRQFQKQLNAVGLRLAGLVLDARRSWTAELDNRGVIRIGRDHIEARMRRFTTVWPRLAANQDRTLLAADLRYPNGFAIRWEKSPGPDRPRGRGK